LAPGTLDVRRLSNDPTTDTEKAINTADEEYGIPKLVDTVDVVNNPDEHSNFDASVFQTIVYFMA
jgi:hypothetical protein